MKVCEQSQRHSISTRKDWSVHKLSHAFGLIGSGTTPASSEESFYGGEVPWLNTGDLTDGEVIEIPKTVTEEAVQRFSALKVYPAESLVIALYGATIGKLGILNRPASVNQACCVLAEPRTLDSKFTFYWLWSSRQQIIELAKGGGQPNISQETVRQLRVEAPPLPTQKAIANFLDRKTAAIDALIEKKEKLLELLAEKRSALINQAVTKGLDPNVPMKDSGIPWIGEIPEHWTTSAISHYAEVFNGSTPTRSDPTHWEGDIPWLSSGKVNEWLVKEPTAWISDKAKRSAGLRLAPVGSIIIGMVGQGKTRGMSARLGIAACINQNMAAIVTARDLAAEFLHYCLIQSYKPNREYGRGGQQDALNCELVRSLRIPLPPKSEQLEIVAFLEDEIHRAAAVAEKATSQIERLREYRQSLITAAVTGQLEIPAEDYEATPTEDRPS